MNVDVFTEGMALLAQGCAPQGLSEAALARQFQFYKRMLTSELSDAEFERAVQVYLLEESAPNEKKWFPTVARLMTLAHPLPTDPELEPIFRGIEQLNRWSPEGHFISHHEVERVYGTIAKQAFLTAGGNVAFQALNSGNNRVFAMKRFFEAFRDAQKLGVRNEMLGPAPDRMRQLVGATAAKLSTPPTPTTARLKDRWNESKP